MDIEKWKEQAEKDGNVVLYNTLLKYQQTGDVEEVFKVIRELDRRLSICRGMTNFR